MSYLARLKQLESGEIFHNTPKPEPTKPTKGAFDGFVGSIPGAYENIHTENDADETRNQEEHWCWLVHFADREPVEVYCNPDADLANIMQTYPDALAAEPIPERIPQVFTEAEDAEWGALWRDTLDWDGPTPEAVSTDDRRRCTQCRRLNPLGRCIAAQGGEIAATQTYEPIRDILRRCEGYMPRASDPDTRPGRECWPGLIQNQETCND